MGYHLNKRFVIITQPYLINILAILIMLGSHTATLANTESKIAVIYPKVREPYIRIFKDIISGIIETIPGSIEQYGINKDENIEDMRNKLDKSGVDAVILLGNRALKMSSILAKDKIVLTGAVFSTPSKTPLESSSISMVISPRALLQKLFILAPKVKTVHVIYNEQKDNWIINQAKEVLQLQGMTLNALPSSDVRSHARLYNDLFKSKSLSNNDAIWLLQNDHSLKEPRIFATILEHAWTQNFVVLSANPNHVRRGVLFAMYPDNRQLGVSLAKKMLSLRSGSANHSINLLEDLLVAVNIRTAEHLELEFSRSEQQSFNMIFPSR